MNIKELAIRGLLEKHGKSHLYQTCPELIDELVQLGEELAPRSKHVRIGDQEVKTTPYVPHRDVWNTPIGDWPYDITCKTNDDYEGSYSDYLSSPMSGF